MTEKIHLMKENSLGQKKTVAQKNNFMTEKIHLMKENFLEPKKYI
jgi:hypothetical protein